MIKKIHNFSYLLENEFRNMKNLNIKWKTCKKKYEAKESIKIIANTYTKNYSGEKSKYKLIN